MVLAASSPFFQKLLGRNKHPFPLINMRGVKSDDLLAIVDFLYRGEANVFQENLASFLAIAEELQLKDFGEDEKPLYAFNRHTKIPKPSFKRPVSSTEIDNPDEKKTLAISSIFSGDFAKLDEKVKSMMEKCENRIASGRKFSDRCKVCGKEGKRSGLIDHIEANHLEGIIIPCNLCDKIFRSRRILRHHKLSHRNNAN